MRISLLSLILTSVAISALAQMFLKMGVGRATAGGAPMTALTSMLSSPLVIVGLGLYGLGALLWLFVLSRAPLSVAYPFVGAGFLMTAVIGVVVLGEQFSWVRFAGTVMIAAGCVTVARSV